MLMTFVGDERSLSKFDIFVSELFFVTNILYGFKIVSEIPKCHPEVDDITLSPTPLKKLLPVSRTDRKWKLSFSEF